MAVGLDQIRRWRLMLQMRWTGGFEWIRAMHRGSAIYYFYPENVVDLHAEVKRKAFQVSDLR